MADFNDINSLFVPPASTNNKNKTLTPPGKLSPGAAGGVMGPSIDIDNDPNYRSFGDINATRGRIFDKAMEEATRLEPVSNARYTLKLSDIAYTGNDRVSKQEHKRALLEGSQLNRKLWGTWNLVDNKSGKTLDKSRKVIANIPYLTDLGTFARGGNDYSLSNQLRLRPGIYTRWKDNGMLEAHVNVASGAGHRIYMNPDSGVFNIEFGQSSIPLKDVLDTLGATKEQMREAWGSGVYTANEHKSDPKAINKLYQRFSYNKGSATTSPEERKQVIRDGFAKMTLDPEVSKFTLGKPYDKVTVDSILDTTKKLLSINRGEGVTDSRDDMAFQRVLGPEDIIGERIAKSQNIMRQLLFKISKNGNLAKLPTGAFNEAVDSALIGSGLGLPIEEVNPLEIADNLYRVTRLGDGGISSLTAVPDSARNVHASQFGIEDPFRTPESGKVGVDGRLTVSSKKGPDGRMYARLRDTEGNMAWKSTQDMAQEPIAFPGEFRRDREFIATIYRGDLRMMPRDKVKYEFPTMQSSQHMMSHMTPAMSGMKGQRAVMAARMLTQALPLKNPEAPLVQSGIPDEDDKSYEELYGDKAGAIRTDEDVKVLEVTPDKMVVTNQNGETRDIELYNNFVFNRKTGITQTPVAQPGDVIPAGGLLARSNFTDNNGTVAVGTNLRTGFLPFRGLNFEDAIVVSESAAKKFTSEHYYKNKINIDPDTIVDKNRFVALKPGVFKREQLENFTDDGLIKPGTEVHNGDPLVLGISQVKPTEAQMKAGRRTVFKDVSITWDHDDPGIVTDVYKGKKGAIAIVKAFRPAQKGDKVCYDGETEVLTYDGWKNVSDVTLNDYVACLENDELVYRQPEATHKHPLGGRMYRIKSQQVDLFVTENHRMYVQPRGKHKQFDLYPAKNIFGKRVSYKKDATWHGTPVTQVTLPAMEVKGGRGGAGVRLMPEVRIPINQYMLLLGAYLSEGSVFDHAPSGSYGIMISQYKPHTYKQFVEATKDLVVSYNAGADGFRFYSKQLMEHFKTIGTSCYTKHIPKWVFSLPKEQLEILFKWMMWGDGHTNKKGRPICYTTTSKQLADDMQQLCLHIGKAANIQYFTDQECHIEGRHYYNLSVYHVRIVSTKLTPTVNHGHVEHQNVQVEEFVDNYDKPVYCITVPNNVLYVRRNGKPVWSGNSALYGNKGVLADVIPDAEMPKDGSGRPLEVLMSPLGTGRGNPSAYAVAVLGKVAEKTGKRYALKDFQDSQDLMGYALSEAEKYGIADTETLLDDTDPDNPLEIPKVLTGNMFFVKTHHTAEDKVQGRSIGGYTMDGKPSRGSDSGSKRIGLLELNALLSSGATENVADIKYVKGQENLDYWRQYMRGFNPPTPRVPYVHDKFVNYLKGAGINIVRDGQRINIMALTANDIDNMTEGRELKGIRDPRSPDMQTLPSVAWDSNLKPLPGGLFDESLTGGHSGKKWSYIKLQDKLPNPVMEQPLRLMLGMTEKQFRNVLAGKHQTKYGTGPNALYEMASNMNIESELARARADIASGKKTYRDAAIKRLGYLKSAQVLGQEPKDWFTDKVPVLPPFYRPVSVMGANKMPMVSDPNYLYKNLFDTNQAYQQSLNYFGRENTGDLSLSLYDSFKAVTGLGDPTSKELQSKKVKGLLQGIFGSGPKFSMIQRQMLGTSVDFSGRGVVTPDPDLDMDSIGIPEKMAWDLYQPKVIRYMTQHGYSGVNAIKAIENKDKAARSALQKVMEETPVLMNRAPTLHKFGIMAAWPRLVADNTVHTSPLIVRGPNMDYDGDAVQVHLPTTKAAAKEAIEKLLPSRNLLNPGDFSAMHTITKEHAIGLNEATKLRKADDDAPEYTFRTVKEFKEAYAKKQVKPFSKVTILK